MRLTLFPTLVGIWSLGTEPAFDQRLYDDLLVVHSRMKTDGSEIWSRQAHDVFNGTLESANQLANMALPWIQREFVGNCGRITQLQGREVVRSNGMEIMPHSDEDECHLQAVYFPNGPELDSFQDFQTQVNQYGPNAFAICNPDWRSSGFGKCLMPWETHAKFWIKPHRGLLVAFDARAVHFQKPYMGNVPFMQVLLNMKVERIDG
ncbi:MAG: hypothetical protein ACKO0Z_03100 [Betaproteobacteria bacterium]